jgi:hypothetical protein
MARVIPDRFAPMHGQYDMASLLKESCFCYLLGSGSLVQVEANERKSVEHIRFGKPRNRRDQQHRIGAQVDHATA